MQPEPVAVKTGFNCVVLSRIGGMPFRIVLDSGAARSLARTSFAEQLRKDHRTKGATYGPRPLSRPVVLEGVIKGRQSSTITKATQIGLDLPDTLSGKMGRLEACFGEMPDCADAIILGFPELARYGYQVEEDDDGHVWVHFHKLGVTMLAETPRQRGYA